MHALSRGNPKYMEHSCSNSFGNYQLRYNDEMVNLLCNANIERLMWESLIQETNDFQKKVDKIDG